MSGAREILLALRRAALEAADPYAATQRALSDITFHTPRPLVLAVGKAAGAMSRAAVDTLRERGHEPRGMLTSHHAQPPIHGLESLVATHPLASGSSVVAAQRALELAGELSAEDEALILVSGGGSALWCAPPEGVTLEAMRARHEELLGSGAPIEEMNASRARTSRIKAGRLARALHPARHVTLILSDVAGQPARVVASGPTLAWPEGATAHEPWPAPDDPCFTRGEHHVITDGLAAARAAAAKARALGLGAELVEAPWQSDWRGLVDALMAPLTASTVRIMWGEPGVTLPKNPGRGGRCQQVALGALTRLSRGDHVGAFATDGVDAVGAAGAIVSRETLERARTLGVDVDTHLARADAHPALDALDALLPEEHTGTNVNDLFMRLREPIGQPSERSLTFD